MYIKQIYTGCLSEAAYYIESNGEAAIIDPLRDIDEYLQLANDRKTKVKYIFETHFHADFVSGHLDLSKATGAPIVYGPGTETKFPVQVAKDNELFSIGNLSITVLHTPGHTLESSCYLLKDAAGKEHCVFTGDTLFVGDVGRPDLAQKGEEITMQDLAGMLYESIHSKLYPLADDVIVYPAHGAGSACGKNMMKETVDTLGNQKRMNYALNQPNKEAFVKAVTDGLLPPPAYFGLNVAMNKKGYESFEAVLNNGMLALTPDEFEAVAENTEALVLDTRDNHIFYKGFIPQSVNIGLNGDFAPWAGGLIVDVKQGLLLVTEQGKEEETVTRLSRVGFDNILGHLKGGFSAWLDAGKTADVVDRITAHQFANEAEPGKDKIIDVRKETEYAAEHIEDAYNRPLALINDWVKDINPEEHFYLHCAGGYRSMMAASILQARGYRNFTEVEGGFDAISKTGIPTTNFVCQTKVMKP